MPTVEEVELVTKLRDEATAQWKSMVKNFDDGAKQMGTSVVDATGKLKSHGKEVSNLSKWIKEQRGEQRQHNFLFSQGREIIGAASVALTALSAAGIVASGDLQKVSNAANSGFVAFQGFNNILGFLPGPFGMIASMAGGLAIGMLNLSNNTEAAKKALEVYNSVINDFVQGIGAEEAKRERELIDIQVKASQSRLRQAEANLTYQRGQVNSVVLTREAINAYNDEMASTEARIDAERRFIASREVQIGVLDTLVQAQEQKAEVDRRQAGARQEELRATYAMLLDTTQVLDLVPQSWQKSITSTEAYNKAVKSTAQSVTGSLNLQLVKMNEVSDAWKTQQVYATEELNLINSTVAVVGNSIVTGLQAAFDGSAGAGRSFMRALLLGFIDMVQGMIIAAEAAALAKGVVSWGATLMADLPMLFAATAGLQTARAIVSRFHDGGSFYVNAPPTQEVPIMVRGGETGIIRTEDQQKAASGGNTFYFQFNAPVPNPEWVVEQVKEKLRLTGLTVDKLLVSHRAGVVLAS